MYFYTLLERLKSRNFVTLYVNGPWNVFSNINAAKNRAHNDAWKLSIERRTSFHNHLARWQILFLDIRFEVKLHKEFGRKPF